MGPPAVTLNHLLSHMTRYYVTCDTTCCRSVPKELQWLQHNSYSYWT